MYYINYSFMIVSVFILCVTLFWHIWNQRNPHKPFTSFSFRWRSQVFGCMFWHRLFFYFFSRIFSFSFRSFSCRVFVSQIHTLRSVFAFSLAEAFPFWQTASNSGWTETNMIALQQISVVWKLFEGNLDSKALAGICLLRRKIKNRQKIYFDSFHSNQKKKKDVEKEKNVRALVRFTRIWCKITSMEQRMKVTLWNRCRSRAQKRKTKKKYTRTERNEHFFCSIRWHPSCIRPILVSFAQCNRTTRVDKYLLCEIRIDALYCIPKPQEFKVHSCLGVQQKFICTQRNPPLVQFSECSSWKLKILRLGVCIHPLSTGCGISLHLTFFFIDLAKALLNIFSIFKLNFFVLIFFFFCYLYAHSLIRVFFFLFFFFPSIYRKIKN